MTSSGPCWWKKTKDLSLASFARPPAIVHCTIVICVSRDELQTPFSLLNNFNLNLLDFNFTTQTNAIH